MTDKDVPDLPAPSSEDQRVAAGHFEYANRATVARDYDIAIQMLRTACRLVPTNLAYRQALRKVEKTKYKNGRGSFLSPLTTLFSRLRLLGACRRGNHLKALDLGEAILAKNPYDRGAHLHMAESASELRLPVLAIWVLQEYREKFAKDVQVNRALAALLEKEGHFTQAMHLWELVAKAVPTDKQAAAKAKQMAVSETLVRGNYEEKVGELPPQVGPAKPRGAPAPPAGKRPSPVKDRAAQEAEALRARVEAKPDSPEAYLQLAAHHSRQGEFDEARAVLQRGLEATGPSADLNLALGDLEIEPLRRKLAEAEERLRVQPGDEKLLKGSEKLKKRINELELAWYRQKADHSREDKNARFELGVRLWRAGHAEEAIRELQAVRNEAKINWQAFYYLGHCFKSRQNWPLARRNFEESLKALPEGEQSHRKELLYELACGHAEAGEVERAVELALDLADRDYAYRDIGRLLEEWQGKLKKGAAAKRS
jgi:tetratricopeptide (TPR) repeat protein